MAGKSIPFDKLYFFHRDDRSLIPKLFKYALVLPLDPKLTSALQCTNPKKVSRHFPERNDATLNLAIPRDTVTWWHTEIWDPENFEDRVAVVPILVTRSHQKLLPKYLTSRLWATTYYKHKRRAPQYILHEQAYLVTPAAAPNHEIRPLCAICPRSLLALQGQCTPGCISCYSALDLNILNEVPCQPTPVQV